MKWLVLVDFIVLYIVQSCFKFQTNKLKNFHRKPVLTVHFWFFRLFCENLDPVNLRLLTREDMSKFLWFDDLEVISYEIFFRWVCIQLLISYCHKWWKLLWQRYSARPLILDWTEPWTELNLSLTNLSCINWIKLVFFYIRRNWTLLFWFWCISALIL